MSDQPLNSKYDLKLFVLESLQELAELHKALDNPIRLEILARLLVEEKEFKNLQDEMNIPKTTLANHLNRLLEKVLVEKLERGLYRISEDGEDILRSSSKVFLEIKMREQQRLEAISRRYEAMIQRYANTSSVIKMNESEKFRIVKLPSMKVASFHEMGEFLGDPEDKAYKKLEIWARPRGIFDDPKFKVFGFNNPDPKYIKETKEFLINKDNPYGYEFWISLSPDFEEDDDLNTKEFEGGLYVVSRCEGVHKLGEVWKNLYDWVKVNSKYKFAPHQCLEHNVNKEEDGEKILFDVYFPISE